MNVITSAISSIVGLGVGFGLGLMVRSASETNGRRLRMSVKDMLNTLLGVVILILVASTVVMQLQSATHSKRTTQCLANAIAIRSEANHDGSVAWRKFLMTFRDHSTTSQQRDAALDSYLATLKKIDEVQQANPIGPGTCDP